MSRRFPHPAPGPLTLAALQDVHVLMWQALGGSGDPPPLIVSNAVYQEAVKVGFPPDRMIIARKP